MANQRPRVLFVASEMYPLAHTGGLGDVAAALPRALRELGVDARVMLPAYPSVREGAMRQATPVNIGSPNRLGETALVAARSPEGDVPLVLVDCPTRFDRAGGPYADARGRDWKDNAERFALLSHAAAMVAHPRSPIGWAPDLVHANDWPAGLVPALLATRRGGRPPTVFSIHNLSFMGIFPRTAFAKLGLPAHVFHMYGVEFFGDVSLMKAGVYFGDRITAVSPSYAREIRTPEFGYGLEGLLAGRGGDLVGILNGIDERRWDPVSDPHIAARYTAATLDAKRADKAALQRELGLDEQPDAFVLGSVSRLTSQKGLDLLLDALASVLDGTIQIAVLGSGDPEVERRFLAAAKGHPGRVAVRIGYDEGLAHRIEAGADAFVMPSRYEPCGLNQMYSQRYGTPPIVHRVGGLGDTVEDGVTGFVFEKPKASALAAAIKRAARAFSDGDGWRAMQLRGMAKDFGWGRAAREYLALYQSLL